MTRTIPEDVIHRVLLKSKRRCCLCYALDGTSTAQIGQLAHADRDPQNGSEDNLVYLCMSHHSMVDNARTQGRAFTGTEIKMARDQMYRDFHQTDVHRQESSSTQEFQRQAEYFLATQLGTLSREARISSNRRVRGKSGHEHEFDVIAEFEVAGLRFLLVAECKDTKRPVGADTVLELSGKMVDVAAHKGIVISRRGFSLAAVHVAKLYRIALVTLKDSKATTVSE